MRQLGLKREALLLERSMSSGNFLPGFNPLERIIGKNQIMSSFFLPLGAERARAVGRIVTQTGVGVGTGFLISSRLLMTNNHVIENDKIAALCRIEFDYVRRFDRGFGATQLFHLLPGEFFLTSVTRDDLNLDYTIVAVSDRSADGQPLDELARVAQRPVGEQEVGADADVRHGEAPPHDRRVARRARTPRALRAARAPRS